MPGLCSRLVPNSSNISMYMRWLLMLLVVGCSSPAKPVVSNTAEPPAKPPAVLVQLAYKGTFMIGPPFSVVPPFTLLDDGTLIGAADDEPVYVTKVSHAEVEHIVQHIRELGFDRLQSHTESCKFSPDGTGVCTSDASITILRVASPTGALREVSTYSNFSNEPETHQKIVDYLEKYKIAKTTRYVPTSGVLHVRLEQTVPKACPPIDAAVLHVDGKQTMWAFRIDGADLAAVLKLAPATRTTFDVCADGLHFVLAFMPAVPGDDLSGELDIYKRH